MRENKCPTAVSSFKSYNYYTLQSNLVESTANIIKISQEYLQFDTKNKNL